MNQHPQKNTLKQKLIWFTIILSIVLINFFDPIIYDDHCNEYLKEDILPLTVCGLISQKYYDKKNHNMKRLFYFEDSQEIIFPIYTMYAKDLWKAIEVGDSIFKEAGSDTVIVKHHKNNSYVIYKLECRFGKKYRNKD